MKTSPCSVRRALRHLAGWCALLLYVWMVSPVGPGLALLLGSLDSDHRVGIEAGGGGVRVVLHHGQACAPHRHGLVARALTSFAPPVTATEPDHVLQFSAGVRSSSQTLSVKTAPPSSIPSGTEEGEPLQIAHHKPALFIVPTHAPPGERGTLLQLRSILLLI